MSDDLTPSNEADPDEVGTAAPYSGTFCFQNTLNGTISSGWAKHWTTDYGTETIDLTGLANNELSASVPFTTSSSNTDHWAFEATVGGITYSVADKHCGFESEDAGGEVILAAFYQFLQFYVGMPVSSGCECSIDEG